MGFADVMGSGSPIPDSDDDSGDSDEEEMEDKKKKSLLSRLKHDGDGSGSDGEMGMEIDPTVRVETVVSAAVRCVIFRHCGMTAVLPASKQAVAMCCVSSAH
jgi:hypothetical protein